MRQQFATVFESNFDYYHTPVIVPAIDDEPDAGAEYMVTLADRSGDKRQVWINEGERRLYCRWTGDDVTEDFEYDFD
jgi:hypothetical protein